MKSWRKKSSRLVSSATKQRPPLALFFGEKRGDRGEARDTDGRHAGGQGQAARRGDADAQAGKGTGPGGDADQIERGGIGARFREQVGDHRHEDFGLTAFLRHRPRRDDGAVAQHGRR